jgi:hypothetical protein
MDAIAVRKLDLHIGFAAQLHQREGPFRVCTVRFPLRRPAVQRLVYRTAAVGCSDELAEPARS